jgi:hypothetical protein
LGDRGWILGMVAPLDPSSWSLNWVLGAVSLMVKRTRPEADHSGPSSAEDDRAMSPLPHSLCGVMVN